jgi:NAD(P)-dependent dehydrogenase (short-subunit alcohol dehydrogenase family)
MTEEVRFLAGRHAVVTGGGRGMGAAIADALARAGATLTLMGRSLAHLEETAAHLRARHSVRVECLMVDVGHDDSVAAAFAEAGDRSGSAYVLVNNAGQSHGGPFLETPGEVWGRLIAVNLTGAYLCARQVLPVMLQAGEGRIVNVASTAGLKGVPRIAAYCASKHGLIGLTRSLALEFAKAGITVNAVCPGYTDTDMAKRAVDRIVAGTGRTVEEARTMIARVNAFGRLVRPEEVADAVAWLCSPAAAGVTGQAIVIGGEIA